MGRRMVLVEEIVLSDDLYPRSFTDYKAVATYAEAMLAGATFPPVLCVEDQDTLYVLDGWHRIAAWKQVGQKKVPCDVQDIPRDQWFEVALRANMSHGLKMTQKDKVMAILRLRRQKLGDSEISNVMQMSVDYLHRLIEAKALITDEETGDGFALKPALAEVKHKLVTDTPFDLEAIQKKYSGQKQFSMIAQVISLLQNGLLNEDDARVTDSIQVLHGLTVQYLKN